MPDQQHENDHDILIRATERIYQLQQSVSRFGGRIGELENINTESRLRDLSIDDDIIRQRLDALEHIVKDWDIKLRLAMWIFGPIGSVVGAIITLALQWALGTQ